MFVTDRGVIRLNSANKILEQIVEELSMALTGLGLATAYLIWSNNCDINLISYHC